MLYDAFGRRPAPLRRLLGPGVWTAAWRALRKGHLVGIPRGHTLVVPGVFAVRDARTVVWQHDSEHSGDHPDLARLPAILAGGADPA